jgi:hypothetical protein
MVCGKLPLTTENPVPAMVAELTVTDELPVELSVTDIAFLVAS